MELLNSIINLEFRSENMVDVITQIEINSPLEKVADYASNPDNIATEKVLQKNKMINEAEMKEHYKVNDAYKDVIRYRL